MGDSKKERTRAISDAFDRADELDRLEEDNDFVAEVKRMDAAMKKSREEQRKEPQG